MAKKYFIFSILVLIALAGFNYNKRQLPVTLVESGINETKVFNGNSGANEFRGTLWETGNNMPGSPRYYGGYSTYERNDTAWMYMSGGDTTGSGVPTRTCYKFNFRTEQWTRIADLPLPLRTHAQVTQGNSIFTFGGQTSATSNGTKKIFKYDVNQNTWSENAQLPDSVFLTSAAVLSDSIIAIAGGVSPSASDAGFQEINEMYFFLTALGIFQNCPILPFVLASANFLSVRSTERDATTVPAYLIGGFKAGSIVSGDVVVCNFDLNNPMNTTYSVRSNVIPGGGLARQTSVLLSNGSIIMSGGSRSASFNPINNHYLYEPVGNTFTELGPSIYPLCAHYIGVQESGSQIRFMITGGITSGPQLNATTQFCTDSLLLSITPISNVIPEKFSLSQNYPNPFNPSTKIRFNIPAANEESRNVVLKVFDVTGKETAVLVDETLKPGIYETNWNAAGYASGIYFYSLKAGTYIETKKMILVK